MVDFLKRVVSVKFDKKEFTVDWYKKELLYSDNTSKEEVAFNSDLNIKNTSNIYNLNQKEIVLDASLEHYDALYETIDSLTEQGSMDTVFTIKMRGVSVDLKISESLTVINTLAVKCSSIRETILHTVAKQIKKPLMITLCALFQVPIKCYDQGNLPESERESDFYLFDETGKDFPCEVKLMGKGNPESADAVFARSGSVLVANKLSEKNKQQMESEGILWVELQTKDGYKRFERVLKELSIPCKPFTSDLEEGLEKILAIILSDDVQDSVTPEVVLRENIFNANSDSDLLIRFE